MPEVTWELSNGAAPANKKKLPFVTPIKIIDSMDDNQKTFFSNYNNMQKRVNQKWIDGIEIGAATAALFLYEVNNMGYRGYTESMEVLIDILDELRAINAKLTVKPVAEVNKEEKVIDDANKQERSGVRGTNRGRGTVANNTGQRE